VVSTIWGVFLAVDPLKAYGERPISDREVDDGVRRLKGP
jgi:hypothetical protein